jgi:uncharacterized protein (TIGR01777 family)
MKILVTGASGFIGSALVPFLTTGGHSVTRLVRREPDGKRGEIRWDPDGGILDARGLEGHDAVVHLAGEGVATGLWTRARKARILESRARGTSLLAETLAGLTRKPGVLLSASAVGYYGSRGDEVLREDGPPGTGFLAEVTRAWENAAAPAEKAGIRVVLARIGIVLGAGGGALAKMLPAFRMGIAGRLGDGRQYMSWIAIDDVLGAIDHALRSNDLSGPVNVTAPEPVTNAAFTRTLARVLSRPAILPVPALALRLALGEMADEALLASTRAVPARLLARGFGFRYPELEGALRHVLGK